MSRIIIHISEREITDDITRSSKIMNPIIQYVGDESSTLVKLDKEKRNKIIKKLFNGDSSLGKCGATLLMEISSIYFDEDFRRNYFKDIFEAFQFAARSIELEGFCVNSFAFNEIKKVIAGEGADYAGMYINYDGYVYALEAFLRMTFPNQKYYIGEVWKYGYR